MFFLLVLFLDPLLCTHFNSLIDQVKMSETAIPGFMLIEKLLCLQFVFSFITLMATISVTDLFVFGDSCLEEKAVLAFIPRITRIFRMMQQN